MNRRRMDISLILAMVLLALTLVYVMLESKADDIFAEAAITYFSVDNSETSTESFGWKPCDFGGCPTITTVPETTEPTTQSENKSTHFRSMGIFKCTAYCGCYRCSEGYGNMTATGVRARPYHTIAVDPSVIPYGTWVVINGNYYKAEDCGGGVRGNSIDIYFDNHRDCNRWGIRYLEVFLP